MAKVLWYAPKINCNLCSRILIEIDYTIPNSDYKLHEAHMWRLIIPWYLAISILKT